MEEVLRVTAVIPAGSACCAGGYACGVYNACKEMRRISEGKLLGTREKSFPQISVFQYPILSEFCTEAHCNARPAQPLSAGRSCQPGHLLVPPGRACADGRCGADGAGRRVGCARARERRAERRPLPPCNPLRLISASGVTVRLLPGPS